VNLADVQSAISQAKSALRKAFKPPDEVQKSWLQSGSATSGITFYDLEAPAKLLVPVLTPFRNMLPRIGAKAGTQANWRAITGINTTFVRPGVSEANRGGVIAHTTADYLAAYKGFGLEDYVSFESDYAARGFDDVKARAVVALLSSTMIAEELVIVGGNTSVPLGITPTPTLAASASGGTLATAAAFSVICVALGYDAFWSLAGYNNGTVGGSLGVGVDPNALTGVRTNADGTTDNINGGTAQKSANAVVAVTGPTGSVTASVTPVPGAFGYAWYWSATAGSELLGAVSSINSVSITALATSAFTVGANLATDRSLVSLEFDGILTQIIKPASGAYVRALANGVAGTGTYLTTDSAGGVAEFNALFQDRWNQYRLSPDVAWCNGQELMNINALVVKNGGAPLIRFGLDANNVAMLDAGTAVGTILNKITNTKVQLKVHPNVPAGAILFQCTQLPYKLSGVVDPLRMLLRQDYYQIQWPIVKRRYEYGVYFDGVLQNYFPPAFGLIYNIGNGY
jgi:hypothetical protein